MTLTSPTQPPPAYAPPQRRVALVIGSGSVKCAAALGLWRVLQREGIGLDLIVGCSGGSLYAATTALGFTAEHAADLSARLFTREATGQRDRAALLRAAFPRLLGFSERFGLRSDRRVVAGIREAFGERTFADATVPLYITATDFHTGEQVVLSRGSVAEAVRASIAIPFAFAPHEVDGRLLIDGFMSDPLPVGVAIKEGANVIVAMGFESPYQTRVTSVGRFAFQMSSIMTNNLLRASFAFHGLAHHGEVIPVIPRFGERIRLFDTAKIPYIIDEGERAMEEQMPYLRRLLAASPAPAASPVPVAPAAAV